MQHAKLAPYLIGGLVGILMLTMVGVMFSSTGTVQAQPRLTRQAQGTPIVNPNANGVSATDVVATAEAVAANTFESVQNLQATATALQDDPESGVVELQARATEIAVTAQSYARTANQFARATATAFSTQIAILSDDMQEQLAVLNEYFTVNGAINYDAGTNTVTASVSFDESHVNNAVDATLLAAGYNNEVTVDFVGQNGTINITVADVVISNGVTADATFVFVPIITADGVVLMLEDVIVNGFTVPPDALDETLLVAVNVAVNQSLTELEYILDYYQVAFDYAVNAIIVTDDTVNVLMSITIQ